MAFCASRQVLGWLEVKWLVGVQGRASEVASEWAEGADCSIFCVRIYPSEPSWKASSDHGAVGLVVVVGPRRRRKEAWLPETRTRNLVHVLVGG